VTSRFLSTGGILAAALVVVSCGTQTYTEAVTTPVPAVVAPPIAEITVLGIKGFPRWPIGPEVERETARLLADSLRVRNPALTVSDPDTDRALLDEAGLGSAWMTLTDIWLETGIADGQLLRDMADAVGADAILGGALLSDQEASGVTGGEARAPSQRVVAVRLWLFDAREGDLVWEAAAESTTEVNESWLTAIFSSIFGSSPEELPPVPLADAVLRAIRDLTTKLPRLAPRPVP
jgi:hypothetical protein